MIIDWRTYSNKGRITARKRGSNVAKYVEIRQHCTPFTPSKHIRKYYTCSEVKREYELDVNAGRQNSSPLHIIQRLNDCLINMKTRHYFFLIVPLQRVYLNFLFYPFLTVMVSDFLICFFFIFIYSCSLIYI